MTREEIIEIIKTDLGVLDFLKAVIKEAVKEMLNNDK